MAFKFYEFLEEVMKFIAASYHQVLFEWLKPDFLTQELFYNLTHSFDDMVDNMAAKPSI